jgi:hypothetical protein
MEPQHLEPATGPEPECDILGLSYTCAAVPDAGQSSMSFGFQTIRSPYTVALEYCTEAMLRILYCMPWHRSSRDSQDQTRE